MKKYGYESKLALMLSVLGFVNIIFLKYLGCKIYGISDKDYEGIYNLSKTKELLEKQYYFDLTKISSKEIEDLLNEIKPDIVFHLAGKGGGIGYMMTNPAETFYDNIMMGTQLINEAKNANVEKFT